MRGRPARGASRDGFALVAAIWLVVAMAVLGTEIAALARVRRLTVANAIERERAEAAANAGAEHARARLVRRLTSPTLSPGSGNNTANRDPWHHVHTVLADSVTLGDARYRVTLVDANALLNVNVADESQLRRFFAAMRIDAGTADQLAQSIVDWRDADSFVHLHGAEAREYLRAGLAALPRNAPLVRVEELRDVYGMTPALFDRIRPLVTVRGSGQVNLNSAPPAVLMSLPGFTEEVALAAVRLRQGGVMISSLQQLSAVLAAGARTRISDATAELMAKVTFETREVEITSDGWLSGSPARRSVTGLFVRGGAHLFFIGKRYQ